jgi:nitrite reductase/ring-hydroxylating ferredoxin subunit
MAAADFIPNQWYPIFDSSKLKQRKPVGIMRLGERLVLWRDGTGTAVCMADRCPHRAAQLSLGWVRDDCLVCPFHGLRFDSFGRCVLIPANGEDQPVPSGSICRRDKCARRTASSGTGTVIPNPPRKSRGLPKPRSRSANQLRAAQLPRFVPAGDGEPRRHASPTVRPSSDNSRRRSSRRSAGSAARRRCHSNEGLAASRTIWLDAAHVQLHLRDSFTNPRDNQLQQGRAVCRQRDADRSRPYVAVGAIWSGVYSGMAGRQDRRAAGCKVRPRVGVHASGHADAREPAAQQSR